MGGKKVILHMLFTHPQDRGSLTKRSVGCFLFFVFFPRWISKQSRLAIWKHLNSTPKAVVRMPTTLRSKYRDGYEIIFLCMVSNNHAFNSCTEDICAYLIDKYNLEVYSGKGLENRHEMKAWYLMVGVLPEVSPLRKVLLCQINRRAHADETC